MKMIKVVSVLFVLGIIFPQILVKDYIIFQTDAIGHNNIYLNKVNPYKQSTFSVGSIELRSLINSVPISRMLPDLNFIGSLDTSAIVSQFKYNRGDYAYRETDILVKNSLSNQADILFNIQGRKNPAYFESDFINIDEYIVQNTLFDLMKKSSKDNNKAFFRLTKHYNKENSQSDSYTENNNLGLEYSFDTAENSIYANLSNLIHSQYNEILNSSYDYQYIDFDFEYLYKNHRYIRPFFNFEYDYIAKDWGVDLDNNIQDLIASDNDLISVELGFLSEFEMLLVKHDLELSLKSNISNQTVIHSDFDFDYKIFFKSWMARFKKFYSYDNVYGQYLFNSVFNGFVAEKGPYNNFRLYRQSYILSQIGWDYKDLHFLISNYNVDLKENILNTNQLIIQDDDGVQSLVDPYNYTFDKSGNFMELQIVYNRSAMESVSPSLNQDILELKLNGLYYSDYSPIKKYRTVDLQFTFKKHVERLFNININLYVPYGGLSISKLKFNQAYGFMFDTGSFVDTGPVNQIDYTLFNYEIGLIFKNFIISYEFLNNTYTDEFAYEFPSNSSDISSPIYNMKYLSVIWKFDN